MTIDVRTLITMLGIASVVQIIAIFFQFSINRSYRGIGWWLIGFISVAVGSALLTLRESIPNEFLAIVFPNLLLIWGPLSFYIGIMRFLEKKENRIFIYVFLAFATILFILARNDMTMRTVAISAALTVTAFFITWNLFTIKPSSLSESTRFTAFLFLIYGAFFAFRATYTAIYSPIDNLFDASILEILTFVTAFIFGILLTFSLIFMVNQRATAEMESAKERFESIFNTGPDASVITNLATGNIVDCNEGYIALSGFTKNELIGKPPAANNLWCSLEERQKVINELKEKGRVDNYEACFQRKDGKQIIGLFSAKVVKLNGIAHTVSITRDVTDRHVAQEKLRESEEKFRLLHENAGIGIGYYTLDGTVISYNQVAAANMGGVPEDFIGKSIYDLFPKKEAEEYHDRIINAANTGQPVTYEDLIKLPNENKYFLSTFTKITDMNNNLAGIQILSQDITERKQIETKLRESEEQFRLAFLTGTDAFYIATLEEGLILEVNNNFESVFGYTRDEAIGQTSLHLGLYDNPADRARMVSAIKSKGYIRDMELQGRKKGGKKITVSISIGLLTINHKPHILGIIRDITERKRAESALKQSEEKYRQLFTMMGEGFALHEIILDSESKPIDYRFIEVNAAFERLTGLKAEKVIGHTIKELLPTTEPYWIEVYGKVALTGEPTSFENYSAALGKWYGTYVYCPAKNQFAVFFSDITERKQAESALREDEERLRTILQLAMDGFWLADRQGRLLEVNESYCKMSGYSAQELLTMKISDLEAVESDEDVAAHISKIIEQGQHRFITRHRRKDGTIFDVENSVQFKLEEGGRFVVFLRDVTERKQALEIIKQSEEQYRALFHNSRSVMMLIGASSGDIKDANEAACKYYGWSHSEMCRKNISEINVLSNEDISKDLQKAAEGKLNRFFFKHRLSTGEQRDVEVYSSPIDIGGSKLLYSLVYDITERKLADEKLIAAFTKETELRKALEFSRALVHELKTPLTPIMATSELLVEELKEEPWSSMAKNIYKGSEILNKRIDELLDLARGEIGMLKVDLASVSPLQLINDIVSEIGPLANKQNQTLKAELPEHLPTLRADEVRIRQVIYNLINNAVKFTGPGGEIIVRARKEGPDFIVEVTDNGKELTEDDKSKLFQPYERLDSDRRKLSGLGLGLALSKNLVELHQGKIWVTSQKTGNTFSFSVPIAGPDVKPG